MGILPCNGIVNVQTLIQPRKYYQFLNQFGIGGYGQEFIANLLLISKQYDCLTSNVDGMESISKHLESSKKRDLGDDSKTSEEPKKLKEPTSASSMSDECDVFNNALDNEN